MNYSAIRRSPRQQRGIVQSHADDDNHSFFDFPDALGGVKNNELADRKQVDSKSHPYPTSISVERMSPNSKQSSDYRSPRASPVGITKDARQPNSPPKNDNVMSSSNKYDDSELSKHHSHGLIHFNSNRLSEAVDSYSHAIRIGLDDLVHHKDMASKLMTSRRDDMIHELGLSLAQVHSDLGQCLEVAQKYKEAKVEYENAVGMLQHTCSVAKHDNRLKQLNANIKRMERAQSVERERQRQAASLEKVSMKLKQASTSIELDGARRGVISSLKKSLRIERDSLGEHSYAFAKLTLKLAKAKCEGGDIEGGLEDANHALATAKSVLGSKHTLVGAACLFVAAVYEKSAMIEYEKSKAKLFNVDAENEEDVLLTPKCKKMMTKALEFYTDAVEPLQFKYDNNISKQSQMAVRPELGDTFHKIAKLNVKKGSYTPAFEAMHRSLEAYGTNAHAPRGSSSKNDVHPNAALVWQDLASLHLASKEYSDAVYAAEKAVELSRQVKKSVYSEKMDMVPVFAFQIAGDGYGGLHRLEDATKSYQKANSELKKITNGGNNRSSIDVHVVGAKILRKLGMSYYHRGMNDDAKTMLMNALSILRSKKDGGEDSTLDMPSLLIDIGMVNIACGDNAEAMNVLRSCLKIFADRGVPDHFSEVIRAKKMFKDTQQEMNQSGAMVGSSEPQVGTSDTTCMPEMEARKSRPTVNLYHSELDSSSKPQMPSIEGNSYEAIPPQKQLEQYLIRIKEIEKERDQEKKDRIFAAAAHRKEIESITQSNRAVLEAELELLRKKVNISEGSYQELVKFIDNEKVTSNEAHESRVRELQSEIQQLRERMESSGAIENMRLSDELAAQLHEVTLLKGRCQEASKDNDSLRETNRTLQSEKRAAEVEIRALKTKNDELHREIQHLSSELAATKLLSSASCVPASNADIKKLEFELQTERNRRQIVEATLQKEFEKGGVGYGGGGGFGYPMPFGFPPMQIPDNSQVAKLKNLEIDLATELAGKEMLEKVIEEMKDTHEQEKNSMISQYTSFVQLHEQETSALLAQVGEKSAEVDVLNSELNNVKSASEALAHQLHDTRKELSDVSEKLSRASLEVSSLLNVKGLLSNTKNELSATKDDLRKTRAELRDLENTAHQKEIECGRLLSENERLKNEYGEAIAMFESEISRVTGDKEEVESALGNEVKRLQSELGSTRSHLQNVLVKLEVLDSDRKVLRNKEEQLHQTQQELIGLTHNYNELEATLAELEEMVATEKIARKESVRSLEDIRGKLIASESVTEQLKEVVNNLKLDKKDFETQLSASNALNKQLDVVLRSVVRQLEGMLPELEVAASFNVDIPHDEISTPNPESVRIHIAHLLQQISKSNNEVGKTHRDLSKATDELRVLEAKHKALKQELAEMGDLQNDYDELLDQYELLVEEKRVSDARIANENESLFNLQNERDMLECRVEDEHEKTQAMEVERSALQAEIACAQEEISKKEERIHALQIDIQLVEELLEKQALEYDAVLLQKDEKLNNLEELVQQYRSQRDITFAISEVDASSKNRKSHLLTTIQLAGGEGIPMCIPCAHAQINPFDDDSSSDGGVDKRTTNPFDEDSSSDAGNSVNSFYEDERSNLKQDNFDCQKHTELRSRVFELEGINADLAQQINDMEIISSRENGERELVTRENDAIKDEINALQERNDVLSTEISEYKEEAVIAAKIHENDGKAIACLQEALNQSKQLHEEELECWMKRFHELQNSYVMLREQLDKSELGSDEMEAQVTNLIDRVRYLENMNSELTARLNDVQNEGDSSFNDQEEQYQREISSWKSRVIELEESIDALRAQVCEQSVEVSASEEHEDCRRKISSLEKDLRIALDCQEQRNIDHNLELARVNAEFHNAVVSMDELSKENKSLKRDLDLLLAKETEDDEHFEKERNAAHQRFESMERALQERLTRMEREKEKLEADFNDEMIKKEDENAQIMIELCAWRLGKYLFQFQLGV